MKFDIDVCKINKSVVDSNYPTFIEYIEMQGEKTPLQLVKDGQIHRYGHKNNRWYVYTEEYEGFDHGAFGDWSTGNTYFWTSKKRGQVLSEHEKEIIERQKKEIEDKRKEVQELARNEALEYWTKLEDADLSNPYIVKKNIHGTYGAKADGDKLVIPLYDDNGDIMSLQTISKDGTKRFWPSAKTKGGWYCVGPMDDPMKIQYIAEGFATAASIYEATGKSCIVAFNAGNLKSVKELFSSLNCRIVMDNDESKTGETKGREADPDAVLIPEVGMDANDYVSTYGYKALKDLLEPQDENRFFKFYDADDFFQKPEDSRSIIKHWLPAGPALAMIYGASGSGKSFTTIDMALSIAAGLPTWNGYKIKRSKVLYICPEGIRSFKKRCRVWCQEHNVTKEDLKGWFTYIEDPVTIDNNKELNKFIDSMEYEGNIPALIVADTLNKVMEGDENATKDATKFILNCTYLQNLYSACLCLVHHTGLGENAQDRARGSSAFKGALDMQIMVSRDEDGIITIAQTKNKDEELYPNLYAKLEDHKIEDWGEDDDGEPYECAIIVPANKNEVTKVRKKSNNELKFTEILSKNGYFDSSTGKPCISKEKLIECLKNEYMEKHPFDKDLDKKSDYEKKVSRAVKRYFEDGFVAKFLNEKDGNGNRLLIERDGNYVYNETTDSNNIMPVSMELHIWLRVKSGKTKKVLSIENSNEQKAEKDSLVNSKSSSYKEGNFLDMEGENFTSKEEEDDIPF